MCFGELNLSEKKMIIDTPCPDGEFKLFHDYTGDGIKDGLMYSDHDQSLYLVTNIGSRDTIMTFEQILAPGSIQGIETQYADKAFHIIDNSRVLLCNYDHPYDQDQNLNDFAQIIDIEHHSISNEHLIESNTFNTLVADFDNDNINELISLNIDGLTVFKIDEANNLVEMYSISSQSYVQRCVVANVNDDVFSDLILLTATEAIIMINTGNLGFSLSSIQVNSIFYTYNTEHYNIDIVDYDGDGDTDIIERGDMDDNSIYIKCYINNSGSYSSIDMHSFDRSDLQENYGYFDFINAQFIDLNGDNCADLIFQRADYDFVTDRKLILNINCNFDVSYQIDLPNGDFVDFNSDGYPDIFSINNSQTGLLYVNIPVSPITFSRMTINFDSTINANNYTITDINNDSMLDIIQIMLVDNKILKCLSESGHTYICSSFQREIPVPKDNILIAPVMSEGNAIVFSSSSGCFYKIVNFEEAEDIEIERITNCIKQHESGNGYEYNWSYLSSDFYFDDINNDSYLDFIYYGVYKWSSISTGTYGTDISMSYSLGGHSTVPIFDQVMPLSTVSYGNCNSLLNQQAMRIMDYDFDGNPNLYCTEQDYYNAYKLRTYWYDLSFDNNGCTISDSFAMSLLTHRELASGIFRDIDIDGDDDFVFKRTDSLLWIENTHGNNLNSASQLLYTGSQYSELIRFFEVSDLNNDGLTDILFVDDYRHKVFAATRRISGDFNDVILLYANGNTQINKISVSDVDDDGYTDIIIYSGNSYVDILENRGYMLFQNMQIDDYCNHVADLVDLDFDGDLDFLYFDAARGEIYWRENYTQVPNSDTSAPSFSANITNYPNPFNPSTNISFNIKEDTDVEITIYNMKGQKVKTLVDKKFQQGQHKVEWNGTNSANQTVGSGVYFYKVNYNGKTQAVKKCVMLK